MSLGVWSTESAGRSRARARGPRRWSARTCPSTRRRARSRLYQRRFWHPNTNVSAFSRSTRFSTDFSCFLNRIFQIFRRKKILSFAQNPKNGRKKSYSCFSTNPAFRGKKSYLYFSFLSLYVFLIKTGRAQRGNFFMQKKSY